MDSDTFTLSKRNASFEGRNFLVTSFLNNCYTFCNFFLLNFNQEVTINKDTTENNRINFIINHLYIKDINIGRKFSKINSKNRIWFTSFIRFCISCDKNKGMALELYVQFY